MQSLVYIDIDVYMYACVYIYIYTLCRQGTRAPVHGVEVDDRRRDAVRQEELVCTCRHYDI